ncbi:MAG: sirohydrochlorin cobaltochelatase [Anaerovibrio sp.]|uniref:sirohydrochlorin cobaltochelatase n=1 Tax=Anaerovibrio sp. TaxID=1872532 RepID=UPI0025FA1515|nr:sirohydrochlorin cobaltochelatase [Anaerovibrio sp.]MCR5177265.1 sirohydrochlorin cobaltochelatase [Anaerovibrio sp.]
MKQAIVVVSFGVSDPITKNKCIDGVIDDIHAEFPDYDVVEAWTSRFLIKKLAAEGIYYGTLEDVLGNLAEAGYQKVVVLPTHLTPGEEFNNKILSVAKARKGSFRELKVMEPVLTGSKPADYAGVAEILMELDSLKEDEELVLMGHGSPNTHNPVYELIQAYADDNNLPVHIGVVEANDYPTLEDVIRRLKAKGVRKVLLRPMMLVGGEHATNDMAGNAPDSWKNVLLSEKIGVRCIVAGLGENKLYRSLYVNKLKNMI